MALETMTSTITAPRHVRATLNYHLEPEKGGFNYLYPGTVGEKRRPVAPVNTIIRDMRSQPDSFHVDVQGFQLLKHACPTEWFEDDKDIRTAYYAHCSDLVKIVTSASAVHVMSHIVRNQDWRAQFEAEKGLDDMARSSGLSYANGVHVDQSYNGAPRRIAEHLPDIAETLGNRRWAIINVWRPLKTVTRSNLAVCDARSILESDLVEIESRFTAEIILAENTTLPKGSKDPYGGRQTNVGWGVLPSRADQHEWWYASQMLPEECLLIKIYDRKEAGSIARRTPHTAFVCEEDFGDTRQSIEARCLVVWDEKVC